METLMQAWIPGAGGAGSFGRVIQLLSGTVRLSSHEDCGFP